MVDIDYKHNVVEIDTGYQYDYDYDYDCLNSDPNYIIILKQHENDIINYYY